MAEKLTPEQKLAVENRGGDLLVSAAAGSGKTKVLVDRLLSYLTDPQDPADLDQFLIITYTRAAAGELRMKIASKLTERIAQDPENRHLQRQLQRLYLTKISTVHGFCGDLLREYAYRLGLDGDFRVADESAAGELQRQALETLLNTAYETLEEDEDFCAFSDSQGLGRNDAQLEDIILKVYEKARCHPDPEGWLDRCLELAAKPAEDAGETLWGRVLMEDLFSWLDRRIPYLERCLSLSRDWPKVCENLTKTLDQARLLRESTTWDQVRQRVALEYPTLRFPTKNIDTDARDTVKAVRNNFKRELQAKEKIFAQSSQEINEDREKSVQIQRGLVHLVRAFDQGYSTLKRQRHILDFGDLEHKTLDLLLGESRCCPTAVAAEVGKRFREVMVDEYQDSNGVQDAIFRSLTEKTHNCFLVGDVKQSIYQFRQAEPGIFLDKYNTYLPVAQAQPGLGRKVQLNRNFRSGPEIVEAVNHVFAQVMSPAAGGLDYGPEEALVEGVPHKPLPDPAVELWVLPGAAKDKSEPVFVAQRIRQMLDAEALVRDGDTFRPVTPEDIVILLRSTKNTAAEYRRALEGFGVRCCTDADGNILETPEVGSLRSLLQTVSNPRQDIPLIAALASPVFGFTADDLAQIRGANKQGPFFDALLAHPTAKGEAFLAMLENFRTMARLRTLTELLEEIFLATNLDGIYAAGPAGDGAKENLRQFYMLAAEFEQGGLCTLERFLDHLDRLEERGVSRAAAQDPGAVRLMTIHSSKGLEFPVVFLCDLSRKFNLSDSMDQLLCHKELGLGVQIADEKKRARYPSLGKLAIAARLRAEVVSEEMRILYVAMTRPKDRLIMTYAAASEDTLAGLGEELAVRDAKAQSEEATSFGRWVLQAALNRPEAGELRNAVGTHGVTTDTQYPWLVRVMPGLDLLPEHDALEEAPVRKPMPENALEELGRRLQFVYPHAAATQAPSKQTATARKGREKDLEAAQDAPEERKPLRVWRTPSFLGPQRDGRAYGSAMHKAMQFLHFEACGDEKSVRREIHRLVEEDFLTPEEGKLVNARQIARFFDTDLGWKLRLGGELLREFKFSILDEGQRYGEGLEGEQVLLQGVVDCAIVEPGGITVLDFKTDRVTKETLEETAERYKDQVETYKEALERIYNKKVTKALLYFFHMGCFVEV